jgi:DNA-binding MarR family transcriptional regulator
VLVPPLLNFAGVKDNRGSCVPIGTRQTGRDRAQIARTIKELEGRRLLLRSAHESDWRSHSLTVTSDGKRACTIIAGARTGLGADVTQDLTPAERGVMVVALQKMKDRLDG